MTERDWSRLGLARDLCAGMARRHGEALLLGGVYGSVARGEETAWSDVEMLFVTRDGQGFPGRHLLYRGVAVGYEVLEEAALRAHLAHPSPDWPFRMGVLSGLTVLHGSEALREEYLALGRSIPPGAFRAALGRAAPGLVVESYGRMHSCLERGDTDALHVSAIEVLLEMGTALCLLNGRWVTRDYLAGLLEAAAFPLLPEGYARLAADLWRETDAARSVALADALVAAYGRLLEQEGVLVRNAQTLDELLAGCHDGPATTGGRT